MDYDKWPASVYMGTSNWEEIMEQTQNLLKELYIPSGLGDIYVYIYIIENGWIYIYGKNGPNIKRLIFNHD